MGYVLIVVAGLFAGYVNAIAGAGSLLTLPVLIFSGLDASAANATNRIAVLAQASSSAVTYRRAGLPTPRGAARLCAAAAGGAAIGAFIATLLEPGTIRIAIAVVMIVMLVLSLLRPKGDRLPSGRALDVTAGMALGFGAIGVYAGFIQAGTGVLILLFLSIVYRVDLVSGNAVKVITNVVLSIVAIAVFAVRGETIDLGRGLLLAAATATGGVLGARSAVRRGERFVRYAVVAAVVASAAKLLWDTFS